MKTPLILEEITKIQFKDIRHYEDFEFLSDEDYDKLEEVDMETTNPRRDYVGTKYTLHNKEDDKYFQVEFYGNDMAMEIGYFGEVEKIVETKEIISYKQK